MMVVFGGAGRAWPMPAPRGAARAWPVEDAAFAAVLLFTTTSRVISPQYMLWLVGLAAMCLCAGASRMGRAAGLVLVATGVTVLEFPVFFAEVTASTPWGVGLLFLRNGLLVAATLYAAGALRRAGAESRAPRTAVGRA